MARLELIVACFLLLRVSSATSTCNQFPQAISLPIRNVTLPDQLERRGVALSVGTSPQPLAFTFQGDLNDTYLYDVSSDCEQNTTAQCAAGRGGNFDTGTSSTWKIATNMTLAGASNESDMALAESNIWGTDDIAFNSSFSLTDHPIAIVRQTNPPPTNVLGLGPNSTILNALASAKVIGSRTWGMFWGWVGADQDHQIDGSLVLGGYDAGKVVGKNITNPFIPDSSCLSGLVIEVTDISMILTNGSTYPIMGTSEGDSMRACIQTQHALITLPEDIYQNFLNIAGGTPTGTQDRSYGLLNFYGMLFEAEGVYTGDLSFTISPGLTVTVPNHQLVVPNYSFGEAGKEIIIEPNTREILLYQLQDVNKDNLPLFGTAFLSALYMLVNEDKQEFTLWESNATSGTEQLVALGPTSTCTSDATTAPIPASSTADPSTSSTAPAVAAHHSSAGPIAGGVVGGVAAIGLLGLAFFLLRRRQRKSNQSGQDTESSNGQKASLISTEAYDKHALQELPAASRPAELYGKEPLQELPMNERPAELVSEDRRVGGGQGHGREVFEMDSGNS